MSIPLIATKIDDVLPKFYVYAYFKHVSDDETFITYELHKAESFMRAVMHRGAFYVCIYEYRGRRGHTDKDVYYRIVDTWVK